MASTSITGRQPEIEITHAFEEIAPRSASACATASTSTQKLLWDVFINHRGPDVKHTLARAMYQALDATGLRVFLDSEELQLGDFLPAALEQAMHSASFHVAIFSRTYAESAWCLAELSFMLKSGATIIPVFYHVQPTDLRWVAQGRGMYAKAFLEHQEKARYSLEKLEEWKMALHNVSFCKGEIINNNDEEQTMLKTIVNHVLKVMQVVPLEVAKHPVGLQEAVADFEKIVSECAEIQQNGQIVGIYGMGGSGKTTFAKELYNKRQPYAEQSSFIFDIRDAAEKNELHVKQMELLQDLGIKSEFNNVEKGKVILSNRLKTDRMLIILDDVDHTDQLDTLLPTKDSLRLGSLIIVTTREKEVLRCWGVSSIYEMKAMNQSHAEQLFCWHAFLQPRPLSGFEELVQKFLSVCNGLPLSLKVLGGQLYGESRKDLWNTLFDEISKILPHDIKKKLKPSYDVLEEEEKQIFLDVACFFIGKDIRTAIAVWEGSGWKGMYRWERLVNKCLVDLNSHNCIRMHDHLRDLGREIANTQSPYRLWSPDQITSIQKRLEERVQIRGMILDTETDYGHKFLRFLVNTSRGSPRFMRWSRRQPFPLGLKILVIRGNYLSKHLSKLSQELAWLSCKHNDHRHLPSWLPLKNLRVLELDDSEKLEELWKDGADAPMELRELVIHSCERFQRIPKSIGLLRHLKKIVVYDSKEVRTLPEEICLLQSLEHLQLNQCEMLSSLPSNFGNLTNLQHLELSCCRELRKMPIAFKQLRFLQHLNIEWCHELTLESDILEYMTKLEYLSLSELPQLKELPRHIANLASLRILCLNRTGIRELPVNIGQLSKLRVMVIRSCEIKSLPESMGCMNLLERLVLTNLAVDHLPQSFTQLINLQFFLVAECPISEFLFGRESISSSLCKLKEILLRRTRVSKILIPEECCPGLLTLTLHDNAHLSEVQALPTALKFIEVDYCKVLRNMRGIGGLSNLQKLKIKNCPEVDALPSFAELTSLQTIEMERCGRVEKIEGLNYCRSLNTLGIFYCSGLNAFPSLPELSSLRKIELKGCQKVSKIGSSQYCRSLEMLLISSCPELYSLPSFAGLISLKIFELKGRNKVEKIEGLQYCKSLERLVVEHTCWEVPAIESSLKHLEGLRMLQLVAKTRSAIEPCIKTIQKWPAEIIVCTEAAPGLGSLLNPSVFSDLSVVHSFASGTIFLLEAALGKPSSNANALMLCLFINCSSPRTMLTISSIDEAVYPISSIRVAVDEGKAMVIGVFTQYSTFISTLTFNIMKVMLDIGNNDGNGVTEVEKGFLVTGEENSIVEAFHRLFDLRAN